MDRFNFNASFLVVSLSIFISAQLGSAQLRQNYYANICPNVENVVRNVVRTKFRKTFVTAPATLRLFFHDCFVQGCDASVIIQSTSHNKAEKDHPDNLSLAGDGFDTVIKAKAAIDAIPRCRNKVSCADILTMATRDVVALTGGPSYAVELGRLDGLSSTAASVNGRLPQPNFNLNQLNSLFAAHGLTQTDMIALSAAHSLGFSHCSKFSNRVYNFARGLKLPNLRLRISYPHSSGKKRVNLMSFVSMADVLSKSNLFSPCPHLCSSISPKKSTSFLGFPSLKFISLKSSSKSDFHGRSMVIPDSQTKPKRVNGLALHAQMSLCIGKAQKWWEKGIQPNMTEIQSAQNLVDSLSNAGDKLVVLDFFSPGCGGCKALHPKICQIAEQNPDVQFLQVNYEEHKSMCYSLNVHVLPFFRFYGGAQGRLCSFSCTNATIKKFKDALAKHKPDRCSLGTAKGLEEKELLALAANKDLSFNYTPKPEPVPAHEMEAAVPVSPKLPLPSIQKVTTKESEEKTLVASGR